MFKLLFYILISNFTLSYSYPFNSSLCVECIKKINYIQNNNNSINNINTIERNINNLCDYYNISGCAERTKKGKEWLFKSPETICRDLDYCDYLSYDNMLVDLDAVVGGRVGKLYRYYDLIILLKEDILLDQHKINNSKIWSIKIDEPYKSNYVLGRGGEECSSCGKPFYLLKLNTKNLLYYINVTNGNILYKYNINKIQNPPYNPMYGFYKYPPSIVPPPPQITNFIIYDTIYNGTFYNSIININTEQSVLASSCSIPTPTNCSNLVSIDFSIEKWDTIFPTEKPRCGQALEMYCPHNFKNREDCLSCVIKNQNIFSVCTIEEEEEWCNNLHREY